MQGKVKQSAACKVYVGIVLEARLRHDVSKGHLDIYLHPLDEAFRVTNDKSGWKKLKRRLQDRDVELIVIEATGKYHRGVHRSLADNGFAVAVLNPYRSRKFSDALGELAKTDEIDAKVLALAGEALRPDATPPQDKALEALQELLHLCNAFKAERTANRNRMDGLEDGFAKKELRLHLASLERRIKNLEAEILTRIKAEPAVLHRFEILTSIPGIGPTTATAMIVNLAELGSLDSKQVTALVGVAPMNWDSGTSCWKRASPRCAASVISKAVERASEHRCIWLRSPLPTLINLA